MAASASASASAAAEADAGDTAPAHTHNMCGVCRHRSATGYVDFSCLYDLREIKWAIAFNIRAWYFDGDSEASEVWNMPWCSTCKKAFVEGVLFWLRQNQRQNTTAHTVYGEEGGGTCACCHTTTADIRYLRFRYHDVHEDFTDSAFVKTDMTQQRARVVGAKKGLLGVYREYELDSKASATAGKMASLPVCKSHRYTFLNWFGSWIDLVRLTRMHLE